MSKVFQSLNDWSNKYAGLLSIVQVAMPFILAGCFWVFTLWLDSAYVNKKLYEDDRAKSEEIFEDIKGKLNVIINNQTGFSVQMDGVNNGLKDHAERLRYLERKNPISSR